MSHAHFPPHFSSDLSSPHTPLPSFSASLSFFSLSFSHLWKNSNYRLQLGETLVNDWEREREEKESRQANKIQRAESLYCHRAFVSGRQEERNNLSFPPSRSLSVLSLSILYFFLSIYSLSLTPTSPLLPRPKHQNSIMNSELLPEIWPGRCLTCHLSKRKAQNVSGQSCWLTTSLLLCSRCSQMVWPLTLQQHKSWCYLHGATLQRQREVVKVCQMKLNHWCFFFLLFRYPSLLWRNVLVGVNFAFGYITVHYVAKKSRIWLQSKNKEIIQKFTLYPRNI